MKRRQKRTEYFHPSEPGIKFELKNQFQRDTVKTIHQNDIVALIGPAGSGKTLLAAYAGVQLLNRGLISKIIIVRLARESNFESIGALPGTLEEKLGFISAPIVDNLGLFMTPTEITKLGVGGKLESLPLSFLRGRSLHNSYIIVEEAQNITPNSLVTILTRISHNSKIVITGDPSQEDFECYSSCHALSKLLSGAPKTSVINFPMGEVFRHPAIPKILFNANKLFTKPRD